MLNAGQTVVANPNGKKGFLIPVTWEVCDYVRVQADTLEEAYEWMQENSDEVPLGTEPGYVDASYKIGEFEECEAYLNEVVEYGTSSKKRAVNIVWDFDEGEEGSFTELPGTADIPGTVTDDEVADWLSDTYGWCVVSFEMEVA